MKLTKAYIGKEVRITWRDPGTWHVKSRRADFSDIPKGPTAQAEWEEFGRIIAIEDGWVQLAHSIGTDPMHITDDRSVDLSVTGVHEALIGTLQILEPRNEREGEST